MAALVFSSVLVGVSGCGGGAPVVSPQMVGFTPRAPKLRSYQSSSPWRTRTEPGNGQRYQQRGQTFKSAAQRRPKGGGYRKIGKPYAVKGKWYSPRVQPNYDEVGTASWYGHDFDGKLTANGEIYDMRALSAAHKTMPLPSYAYVTNLKNNRTVLVRINDRGPFKPGRIVDLSERVSQELGFKSHGLANVRVRYAGPAPLDGNDRRENAFLVRQSWHRHASR